MIFPFLIKVATGFQMLGTVMTANATSDKHEKLGKDMLEVYLKEHVKLDEE